MLGKDGFAEDIGSANFECKTGESDPHWVSGHIVLPILHKLLLVHNQRISFGMLQVAWKTILVELRQTMENWSIVLHFSIFVNHNSWRERERVLLVP